jgi:DNA-binding response OmpR family regulator
MSSPSPTGPARALVLVQQPLIGELITLTLRHGAYVTRVVQDATDAIAVLEHWHPDLAILTMDRGEQRLPCFAVGSMEGRLEIPVLALTQRGDLQAKLAAFAQGVEDILTIPFSPEDLLARVLAITRGAPDHARSFNPVQQLGALEINILQRQVRTGRAELPLTGLEQSLLYLLAARAGQLVTREEILEALWGVDYVAEPPVVDRYIWNLRAKLHDTERQPRFIATVPGQGYRFITTYVVSNQAS